MLNEKKLVVGISKTISNARLLLDDAYFLNKFERYPRAYTLFQLSIEEAGKCLVLHNTLIRFFQGERIDENHLRKYGFLDHKLKAKASIRLELGALLMFKNSGNDISNLLNTLANENESVNLRNDRKNESLYVTLHEGNFIAPVESISKKDVTEIAEIALIRFKVAESFSSTTNDLTNLRLIAIELQKIESDPKSVLEYQKKIQEWINK